MQNNIFSLIILNVLLPLSTSVTTLCGLLLGDAGGNAESEFDVDGALSEVFDVLCALFKCRFVFDIFALRENAFVKELRNCK